MLKKLGRHLAQQYIGCIALVFALSGTAYAAATIGSADVIDNSLKSVDIKNDGAQDGGLRSEDIAGDALVAADLASNSVGAAELNPSAFAIGDIASTASGFGIPGDAIQSSEVSDDTLTGADVAESTLTQLDGHDSYDATCDPGSLTDVVCDELSFTLGRAMSVSATWAYGFGTDGGEPPIGQCHTTLDGNFKSGGLFLQSEDDSDHNIGGKPVVDVMSLTAGTHTIGFTCREEAPSSSDIVIRDLHMAVIELAFD